MKIGSFNFCKTFETLFHLTCIAATIGTTCWCFYVFILDNDVCLVDFKKYGEEKEYMYPSFALTFVNPFIEEKLKKNLRKKDMEVKDMIILEVIHGEVCLLI